MQLIQRILWIGFFASPFTCSGAPQSNPLGQDHACLKEYQLNNFEKAITLCMPAAKLNDPEAQYVIGMLHKRGKVLERSESKAMQWLTLAADSGYTAAQIKLGTMHSTTAHPDYVKAFNYFLSSAQQDAFEAQFLVALCYQNGLGVSKNASLALQWYNKAIANGLDAPFIDRMEIPKVTRKPHAFLKTSDNFAAKKIAAEKGDANAQFEVAKHYLNGQDTEQDDVMALNYFKTAAAIGNHQAKSYIAWMNALGLGTPTNLPEAIYWFASCYDVGLAQPVSILPPASEQEAKDYTKTLYDQALKLVEDNNIDSQKQGITLLSYAANNNFVNAQVLLAKAYQTGKWVKQDSTEAAKWFEKAANNGASDAQYALGWLYFNGEGVPKDVKLAYYWFDKAALNGDVTAKSAKTFVQTYLSSNEKPSQNLFQAYKDAIEAQSSKKILKSPPSLKPQRPNKDRMAGR